MTLQWSKSLRLARHNRLAQLDKHQTSKPVMVSCEYNSHLRQLIFLLKPFKTPPCRCCIEMSYLCYLLKPRFAFNVSFWFFHKLYYFFTFKDVKGRSQVVRWEDEVASSFVYILPNYLYFYYSYQLSVFEKFKKSPSLGVVEISI